MLYRLCDWLLIKILWRHNIKTHVYGLLNMFMVIFRLHLFNFSIHVLIFPNSAPPIPKQTWSLHQYVSSGWQTMEENPPQFYTVIQQLKD